jgi:hypothetical protein
LATIVDQSGSSQAYLDKWSELTGWHVYVDENNQLQADKPVGVGFEPGHSDVSRMVLNTLLGDPGLNIILIGAAFTAGGVDQENTNNHYVSMNGLANYNAVAPGVGTAGFLHEQAEADLVYNDPASMETRTVGETTVKFPFTGHTYGILVEDSYFAEQGLPYYKPYTGTQGEPLSTRDASGKKTWTVFDYGSIYIQVDLVKQGAPTPWP